MASSYATGPGWAEAWQRSWDRLEERHVADRDRRIGALLDVVDATNGASPTVLDLAGGTGTITRRLLQRWPAACSIVVDVDPVLLAIASATFDGDDRVRIVRADLREPLWINAVAEQQVDAAITATALHWLPEVAVRRTYHDLAGLVRPGGVVAHAEDMPLLDLPILGAGLSGTERRRASLLQAEGPDWNAWWEGAAEDPGAASRRRGAASRFPDQLPDRRVLSARRLAHHGATRRRLLGSGRRVAFRHRRSRRCRALADPQSIVPMS